MSRACVNRCEYGGCIDTRTLPLSGECEGTCSRDKPICMGVSDCPSPRQKSKGGGSGGLVSLPPSPPDLFSSWELDWGVEGMETWLALGFGEGRGRKHLPDPHQIPACGL